METNPWIASAVLVAVVTGVKELVIWILNRKAHLKDKVGETEESAAEARLVKIEDGMEGLSGELKEVAKLLSDMKDTVESYHQDSMQSDRVILQDRIKFIAIQRIKQQKIKFEDRKFLNNMWKTYHEILAGNGDLDPLMKQINELPLDLD